MDAVEFFKTVNRLCKNQSGCEKCPVYKEGICMVMRMIRLDDDLVKSIEETVSKVEQWAKGHPVKTRQSELLYNYGACNGGAIAPACILNPKSLNLLQNMAYVEEVAE